MRLVPAMASGGLVSVSQPARSMNVLVKVDMTKAIQVVGSLEKCYTSAGPLTIYNVTKERSQKPRKNASTGR